jgi:hypothetical protein
VLRVGSIVIRVDDLARQKAFWAAALDYVAREDLADAFVLPRPRDGRGPNVSLDRVNSAVHLPPRIHLDLYAEDQAAEVERLVGLGASRVEWKRRPADADYVILRATGSASLTPPSAPRPRLRPRSRPARRAASTRANTPLDPRGQMAAGARSVNCRSSDQQVICAPGGVRTRGQQEGPAFGRQ